MSKKTECPKQEFPIVPIFAILVFALGLWVFAQGVFSSTSNNESVIITVVVPSPVPPTIDTQTPEAVGVYLVDTPTPPISTLVPMVATAAAEKTRIAVVRYEATKAAKPKDCSVSASGELCIGSTVTMIPEPTWTPTALCLPTPIPDELCIKP